jgi:hypothetical protein
MYLSMILSACIIVGYTLGWNCISLVVVTREKGVPVNDATVVTEKHLMKCKEGRQTPSSYVMIAESLMSL